jgi:hypothetical protein
MHENKMIRLAGVGSDHITLCVLAQRSIGEPLNVNWLTTRVSIELPSFTAEVEGSIQIDALRRFYLDLQSLQQSLEGTASLIQDETWVQMSISATRYGYIQISGSVAAYDIGHAKSRLEFTFVEVDQTYLNPVLEQLKVVLLHYGDCR